MRKCFGDFFSIKDFFFNKEIENQLTTRCVKRAGRPAGQTARLENLGPGWAAEKFCRPNWARKKNMFFAKKIVALCNFAVNMGTSKKMFPNEGAFLKTSWITCSFMHFLCVQNWSGLTGLEKHFVGRAGPLKKISGWIGPGF